MISFRAESDKKNPREIDSGGIGYHLKWRAYCNVIGKRPWFSESTQTGLSNGAKKSPKSDSYHGDMPS